jgi:hypothetical protein
MPNAIKEVISRKNRNTRFRKCSDIGIYRSKVMKYLILLSIFSTFSLSAQTHTPINIETVRKEILTKDNIVPGDVIKKMKPASFIVTYAGSLCFVQAPYKSPAADPSSRSSDMMVYKLTNGEWIFENLLQVWYDFKLIDATQLIFLADVTICDPPGNCKTYKSVSQYDGNELIVMRQYSGYDKTLYVDDLNKKGKLNDIKVAVGDTISRTTTLYDFHFEQHQASFTVHKKDEAITSISKLMVKKKVVADNFERVIANY